MVDFPASHVSFFGEMNNAPKTKGGHLRSSPLVIGSCRHQAFQVPKMEESSPNISAVWTSKAYAREKKKLTPKVAKHKVQEKTSYFRYLKFLVMCNAYLFSKILLEKTSDYASAAMPGQLNPQRPVGLTGLREPTVVDHDTRWA